MPRLHAIAFAIGLLALPVAAQDKSPAKPAGQTIILDIRMVEIHSTRPEDLEKIAKEKGRLDYMIGEGKAQPVASLQLRTRSGKESRARAGQRVPVPTTPPTVVRRDSLGRVYPQDPWDQAVGGYGAPPLAYENTGMTVTALPRLLGDGQVEINLEIEISDIQRDTNSLAPTILQRTIYDMVIVRPDEPALLVGLIQHEMLSPAFSRPSNTQPISQPRGNFVVLVTARLLE